VAIRADVQRRGHGRALLSLAQQFAEDAGCAKLVSFVAPGAIGFYQRSGFEIDESRMMGPSSPESVFMSKDLTIKPS
jgi:ribosomal protein S18 acetylase RimI-like enzyme